MIVDNDEDRDDDHFYLQANHHNMCVCKNVRIWSRSLENLYVKFIFFDDCLNVQNVGKSV